MTRLGAFYFKSSLDAFVADRYDMCTDVSATAFAERLRHGCRDVYGGTARWPVDAISDVAGACCVTMSEEFAVLPATSGIVGVPVLQYCYNQDQYGAFLAPGLSNDDFYAKHGFYRVAGTNKPYYWRAGPVV